MFSLVKFENGELYITKSKDVNTKEKNASSLCTVKYHGGWYAAKLLLENDSKNYLIDQKNIIENEISSENESSNDSMLQSKLPFSIKTTRPECSDRSVLLAKNANCELRTSQKILSERGSSKLCPKRDSMLKSTLQFFPKTKIRNYNSLMPEISPTGTSEEKTCAIQILTPPNKSDILHVELEFNKKKTKSNGFKSQMSATSSAAAPTSETQNCTILHHNENSSSNKHASSHQTFESTTSDVEECVNQALDNESILPKEFCYNSNIKSEVTDIPKRASSTLSPATTEEQWPTNSAPTTSVVSIDFVKENFSHSKSQMSATSSAAVPTSELQNCTILHHNENFSSNEHASSHQTLESTTSDVEECVNQAQNCTILHHNKISTSNEHASSHQTFESTTSDLEECVNQALDNESVLPKEFCYNSNIKSKVTDMPKRASSNLSPATTEEQWPTNSAPTTSVVSIDFVKENFSHSKSQISATSSAAAPTSELQNCTILHHNENFSSNEHASSHQTFESTTSDVEECVNQAQNCTILHHNEISTSNEHASSHQTFESTTSDLEECVNQALDNESVLPKEFCYNSNIKSEVTDMPKRASSNLSPATTEEQWPTNSAPTTSVVSIDFVKENFSHSKSQISATSSAAAPTSELQNCTILHHNENFSSNEHASSHQTFESTTSDVEECVNQAQNCTILHHNEISTSNEHASSHQTFESTTSDLEECVNQALDNESVLPKEFCYNSNIKSEVTDMPKRASSNLSPATTEEQWSTNSAPTTSVVSIDFVKENFSHSKSQMSATSSAAAPTSELQNCTILHHNENFSSNEHASSHQTFESTTSDVEECVNQAQNCTILHHNEISTSNEHASSHQTFESTTSDLEECVHQALDNESVLPKEFCYNSNIKSEVTDMPKRASSNLSPATTEEQWSTNSAPTISVVSIDFVKENFSHSKSQMSATSSAAAPTSELQNCTILHHNENFSSNEHASSHQTFESTTSDVEECVNQAQNCTILHHNEISTSNEHASSHQTFESTTSDLEECVNQALDNESVLPKEFCYNSNIKSEVTDMPKRASSNLSPTTTKEQWPTNSAPTTSVVSIDFVKENFSHSKSQMSATSSAAAPTSENQNCTILHHNENSISNEHASPHQAFESTTSDVEECVNQALDNESILSKEFSHNSGTTDTPNKASSNLSPATTEKRWPTNSAPTTSVVNIDFVKEKFNHDLEKESTPVVINSTIYEQESFRIASMRNSSSEVADITYESSATSNKQDSLHNSSSEIANITYEPFSNLSSAATETQLQTNCARTTSSVSTDFVEHFSRTLEKESTPAIINSTFNEQESFQKASLRNSSSEVADIIYEGSATSNKQDSLHNSSSEIANITYEPFSNLSSAATEIQLQTNCARTTSSVSTDLVEHFSRTLEKESTPAIINSTFNEQESFQKASLRNSSSEVADITYEGSATSNKQDSLHNSSSEIANITYEPFSNLSSAATEIQLQTNCARTTSSVSTDFGEHFSRTLEKESTPAIINSTFNEQKSFRKTRVVTKQESLQNSSSEIADIIYETFSNLSSAATEIQFQTNCVPTTSAVNTDFLEHFSRALEKEATPAIINSTFNEQESFRKASLRNSSSEVADITYEGSATSNKQESLQNSSSEIADIIYETFSNLSSAATEIQFQTNCVPTTSAVNTEEHFSYDLRKEPTSPVINFISNKQESFRKAPLDNSSSEIVDIRYEASLNRSAAATRTQMPTNCAPTAPVYSDFVEEHLNHALEKKSTLLNKNSTFYEQESFRKASLHNSSSEVAAASSTSKTNPDSSFSVNNASVSEYLPDTTLDTTVGSVPRNLELNSKNNVEMVNKNLILPVVSVPHSDRVKKYFCIFCKTLQSKIARHLFLKHSTEKKVEEASRMPLKSKERLRIISELRKEGNFLHNTSSEYNSGILIVSRQQQAKSQNSVDDYICCRNCKGFFSKSTLRIHLAKCSKINKNSRHNMANGRMLTQYMHEVANYTVRTKIFPILRNDYVTKSIRYDELVIKFANKLSEKYTLAHQHDMIRSQLRLLGRFMIEIKAINNSVRELKDVFHPRVFDDCIKALRTVAGWDESLMWFRAPAVAQNLTSLIKKCGSKQRSEFIKADLKGLIKELENFLLLWEEETPLLINKKAVDDQCNKKRIKKEVLPSMNDIKKLYSFLKQKMFDAISILEKNFDLNCWDALIKATLIFVQIFNRRRAGEIERLTINNYLNKQIITENVEKDLLENMSKESILLAKQFVRLTLRGKLGRTVSVLLSPLSTKAIDLIIKHRSEAGIIEDNEYIFAHKQFSEFSKPYCRACPLLKQFSLECGAEFPESLRGTSLRKHIATHTSLLNVEDATVDQLANFMGHHKDIHKGVYRVSVPVAEVTRVSKLLMSAIGNDEDLEEIENVEISEGSGLDDDFDGPSTSNASKNSLLSKKRRSTSPYGKTKRVKWSENEREAVHSVFGNLKDLKKLPSQSECLEAIKTNSALKGRTPQQIKTWIDNQRRYK